MNNHRYILEPYKGMKYKCPECSKDKVFVRYIDKETGEHIHPTVGRCDRESSCGHHYTPKQYFQDNNISFDTPQQKTYKPRPVTFQPKPVSFIPVDILKASLNLTAFETNHFVQFLISLFGDEVASQLVSRYFIATSKYWNGATVFWQIDTQGKVRTGKIMLYNPTTGKRVKEPFNHINWVHKALKQAEFELKQCLFGEHLLIDKTKPVAIVESEKTAVIASVYLPQFIWVAVGSLTNLNAERCNVLKGRTVILFPDLKGFEKWSNKGKELSHIANFVTSELLERKATDIERKQGFDLADYLVKFSYHDFEQTEIRITKTNQVSGSYNDFEAIDQGGHEIMPERLKTINWSENITELENFYSIIQLPSQPIQLKAGETIINIPLFVSNHFDTVKSNKGNSTYLPYLNRLQELKAILKA